MSKSKTAYFASGCFWCITPTFQALPGVRSVISGYAGGDEVNPCYADVKGQKTGHRETVRVEYNPEKIDFETLFQVFLNNVDPFDGEGQFIDRGFSYTLAVYCMDEEQKRIAETAICALEAASGKQVCIALEPYKNFYPAEEYHQDYHRKNPEAFERELVESGRKKAIRLH